MLKTLKWDTDFFNLPFIQLDDPFQCSELEKTTYEMPTFFAQTLQNIEETKNIQKFEKYGFNFVDLRITFNLKINQLSTTELNPIFIIKQSQVDDYERLRLIAPMLAKHSRFENYFPNHKIINLYEKWLFNAIHGLYDDLSFHILYEKEYAGFITLKKDNNSAKIGLLAINKKFQGKSLGSSLIKFIIDYSIKHSISLIQVITEGKNIQAQNFYIKNGFTIEKIESWLYKSKNISTC